MGSMGRVQLDRLALRERSSFFRSMASRVISDYSYYIDDIVASTYTEFVMRNEHQARQRQKNL